MSSEPTVLTPEIYSYFEKNSNAEDDFLKKLSTEAVKAGIPEIAISGPQARYMQFLVKSTGARNILEFGTLAGYSAISMARALPEGGRLTTVEIEPMHAEFARNMAREAGLENEIEVVLSDAKEFVDTLNPATPYDLIFVDADKKDYKYIFDKTEKFLRKGGIFAADNCFAFGDIVSDTPEEPDNVEAIREFNRYFLHNNNYFTCIVPIGDGLALGIKK